MVFLHPPHRHRNCYSRKPKALCSQSYSASCPEMACSVTSICRQQEGWSWAGKQNSSQGVLRCLFQNTSLLFWPREQEIGQLKQDVVNLKSTIAKEEERAADLKHRVQVFSSEEHNTDVQVLLEIKARWDSMAMSSFSPLTIIILGKQGQRAGISTFLSSGAAARAGLGHSAGSKLGQMCPHHAAAMRGEENPQRHPGCCNLAWAMAQKNGSIQPSHPRHCKANWEANNWVLLRKFKSTGFLFYSFEGM